MKRKSVRIVIFILATIILIFSFYSLYTDVDFFVTRRETSGRILGIVSQGAHDPLLVKVSYYNSFVYKLVTCNVEITKDNENKLRKSDLNYVLVSYGKTDTKVVYLCEYREPKIGIIYFDLSIIIAMCIAVYAAIRPATPSV